MRNHLVLGLLLALNGAGLFVCQWLILNFLGATEIADAFVASSTIPQILVVVLNVSLSSVLVPYFAGECRERQNEDGWRLIYAVAVIAALVAAVLYITVELWVALFFPGFTSFTAAICADITRIQLTAFPFIVVASVVIAVYHARHQFILVAARTFGVTALSIPGIYYLLPLYGVTAAAWVALLGAIIQLSVLLPGVGRPCRFTLALSPSLRASWERIKPMLLGNVYYKTDILVDRYLLSGGAAGDIALYGFARQIYDGGGGVISKTLAVTAVPRLAIFVKQRSRAQFWDFYKRRVGFLFAIGLLAYLVIFFGEQLLFEPLFGGGRLTAEGAHRLWFLMVLLGGTFVFGIVGSILAGAFYSLGDTRTPTKMGVVTFTCFIAIRILAFREFGLAGVSVAATVYYLVNVVLMALLFPAAVEKRFSHG